MRYLHSKLIEKCGEMEIARRIFTGFVLIMLLLSGTAPHAIYISVVTIEHLEGADQVSLWVRVFTDDLRDAVRNFSDEYKATELDQFVSTHTSPIEKYFKQHLNIYVDGQIIEFHLTDTNRENDAHFLDFTGKYNGTWTSMKVKGEFFSEVFPDQSNIFTIKNGSSKFHYRLNKRSPIFNLTF